MKIGAQLYTLREFCKDLQSFSQTLKRVADMGYTAVQVSGTCAYDPAWLKQELDKNGLACVLTHIPADRLKTQAAQVARDHDVFDCRCVGLGFYGFNEEEPENTFDSFFDAYLPVAKTLRENGKYFMYHNHDREFQKRDGKIVLAHIAERFPAEELGFTLDTFWAQRSGADPAYWIEQLSGRVPVIHLKDCTFDGKTAALGDGNIHFDRVFEKAEAAGTQYMLVEQDWCYDEDPFDCLQKSCRYLKARGFE